MVDQFIAGAVVGAIAGDIAEDGIKHGSEALGLQTGLDTHLFHLSQQTTFLDRIVQAIEAAQKRAVTPHGEYISFSQTAAYDISSLGRAHLSLFCTVPFPLIVRTPLGDMSFGMIPGWNALDPPPGARLLVGAGGPALAQVFLFWSEVPLNISYSESPQAVSGTTSDGEATITRPADTTAYTAGDAVANSTSAPTTLTFASVARANGGSGVILGAQLIDDSAPATVGQFVLYLFSASPTPTNDNSALSVSDADALNLVGIIPFTTSKGLTACTVYAPFALGDASPFGFTCDAASSSLFGLLQAANGYTPASAGVLTISLVVAN